MPEATREIYTINHLGQTATRSHSLWDLIVTTGSPNEEIRIAVRVHASDQAKREVTQRRKK